MTSIPEYAISNSPPHNDPATNILKITISYSRQHKIVTNIASVIKIRQIGDNAD